MKYEIDQLIIVQTNLSIKNAFTKKWLEFILFDVLSEVLSAHLLKNSLTKPFHQILI